MFSLKYLYLSDFNETLTSATDFQKNTQISNHQNLSSESCGFACGQTDTVKLTSDFCNFVNAPKMYKHKM